VENLAFGFRSGILRVISVNQYEVKIINDRNES